MPYYWMTVIMGRLIADQENTMTIPVHGSRKCAVIDLTTMTLRVEHQVFNQPHVVSYNGGVTYLDNHGFRNYLMQSPPRSTRYVANARIMLIFLSSPYLGIGVIRMRPVPIEIVG